MKILLCLTVLAVLPSCITVTGELNLPSSGKPNGFGGRIGGSFTWPKPQPYILPEPPLPQTPSGKEPVAPLL